MNKKRYFILSPMSEDNTRMEALRNSAASYYGQKDYELATIDKDFCDRVFEMMADCDEQNASLFLIGIAALVLARCDSVFMAKGWNDDDHCKFIHMLAFSHGIDIVYESI